MSLPAFSANLNFLFTEWSFADRFEAAAEAGFKRVECVMPYVIAPEALESQLSANGLTLALINAFPGSWEDGDRGLAAIPERRAEFLARLGRTADYVKAGRAQCVHLMAGLAPSRSPVARSTYARSVDEAAERFAPYGVKVLLEPINPVDMPGYHLCSFETCAQVIAGAASRQVGMQFDAYHCARLGGEVVDALRRWFSLVGHVQVASAPDRREPDHGEVDYAEVFATLAELRYTGAVGCEYRPANGTLAGLSWMRRYAPEGVSVSEGAAEHGG